MNDEATDQGLRLIYLYYLRNFPFLADPFKLEMEILRIRNIIYPK